MVMVDVESDGPLGFDELLAQLRPSTNRELGECLSKLLDAVRATGKSGSLSVTIKLAASHSEDSSIEVSDKISLKLPEHSRRPSVAFVGRGGRLRADDPNAMFGMSGNIVDFSTGEVQ